jgi:lipoyl(octanoyl) transferase
VPDAFLCACAGPVPHGEAWAWQRGWQRRLLAAQAGGSACPDLLLLLEHPPCYTLGRGADLSHLRFDPARPPAPLHRLDRGGEVTHHAPGQLVAYPVLDLQRRHGADLHAYLRSLEGAVLELLDGLGLAGERRPGLTGIWLQGRKVAAIGVSARRWVTQHGLAVNVTIDLGGFDAIAPCGLDLPVGRLLDHRPGLTVADLRQPLADALGRRLGWSTVAALAPQTLASLVADADADADGRGPGALER